MQKIRYWLLRLSYPIIKLVAKIELPHRKIQYKEYFDCIKKLKRGDVLLCRQKWSLANLVIPGFYKHAAIYAGKLNDTPHVVEAVTKGVVLSPLVDFMLTKDFILVRRSSFSDEKQALAAAGHAYKQVGKKYDYLFNYRNTEAFYCAELIAYAFDSVHKPSPMKFRKTLGVETVTPDDFANADDKFMTVCGYK